MRLLLQLSLAAADDGSVLERADACSSIVSRRVLLVERVVCCRQRAIRPDGLRHWLVRLLCGPAFTTADELAELHADRRADSRSDGHADRLANYHADSRPDSRSDGKTDGLADCHADGRADDRTDSCAYGRTDGHADYHADGRTDGRTDGCADEHANGHADNASDRAADVNTDGPSDGRLVYNCVRVAGVNVRRHIRRHLLRRSSCV